jgi:hypothetical protein
VLWSSRQSLCHIWQVCLVCRLLESHFSLKGASISSVQTYSLNENKFYQKYLKSMPLHYITLHYIKLHYIALYYIRLHCTPWIQVSGNDFRCGICHIQKHMDSVSEVFTQKKNKKKQWLHMRLFKNTSTCIHEYCELTLFTTPLSGWVSF